MADYPKFLEEVASVFHASSFKNANIVKVMCEAAAELRRLQAENASLWALAEFGKWCFDAHRENFTDLDGGDLQESAESFGLIKAIKVTERCDVGDCQCADNGDFPALCYRSTTLATLPEKRE